MFYFMELGYLVTPFKTQEARELFRDGSDLASHNSPSKVASPPPQSATIHHILRCEQKLLLTSATNVCFICIVDVSMRRCDNNSTGYRARRALYRFKPASGRGRVGCPL